MSEPDIHKLDIAVGRAARAADLMRNEELTAAFKTLEDTYTQAWRSTTVDDVGAREKLFLAVNLIGKVQEHLAKVLANGRLAAHELRTIAEAAERKKAWHEIR